ncbi:MAG: hypothetical protein H7Z19_02970 [Chitinophagaceae bacterium]|nr:hypothetical protein [Rubrivivax sp.]
MARIIWNVVELLALAAIVAGVAMWSLPLALIVSGVLAVAASWVVNHK